MLFFYNKKMLGETLLITIQNSEEVTYEDKKNITLIKDNSIILDMRTLRTREFDIVKAALEEVTK